MERRRSIQEELNRQRKQNKRVARVFITIIIIVVAVYLAGCVYFSKHFYGNGTVFGIPVSNQTVDALKDKIVEKVGEYQMVIQTRDGSEVITAEDIQLAYDDKGEIEELLREQKKGAWFLMKATEEDDLNIEMVLNESMMMERIEGLQCMDPSRMTAPTDAYLEYENDQFVIREETYGNQVKHDFTLETIANAVRNGENEIDIDALGCYEAPNVLQDSPDLIKQRDAVNKVAGITITYDFGDRTIAAEGKEIAEWVEFNDDYTYELNRDKVAAFVHDMAYETDTFGLSRTFKTHGGSEIKLKGGDYGWCINQGKTVDEMIDLIKAGESATAEPVYRYKGVCRDKNDIGGNYVEVSISAQNMWVYKDGKCVVDTPVVTGNTSMDWGTPSGGVWAVDARMPDYMLTGQDYNTHVDYWLPFNGNVGIHDANWRAEFGGTIYKTNGSHGCVNTPPEKMKDVYANVKIGYPVVVY